LHAHTSLSLSLYIYIKADKIEHWVTFGAVAGENRGDLAMDPPRLLPDPYFWMRDDARTNPQVLARLAAENAHAVAATAHLADFRDALYAELKGHVKETDDSAPVAKGAWEYFTRTLDGQGYAIHCRRPRGAKSAGVSAQEADVEVLLDENALAAMNTDSSFTSVCRAKPREDISLEARATCLYMHVHAKR
jgi:oligopeptidase B